MNERELLELAAKAAGYSVRCVGDGRHGGDVVFYTEPDQLYWNPRDDDGDCARMEAALGIDVSWTSAYVMADHDSLLDCMIEPFNPHNGDKQAARRMASLRVAAAIGKAMS